MKKHLIFMLITLPFIFTSCDKEQSAAWIGWNGAIGMTKNDFLNSEYMSYPETTNHENNSYYNKNYCARSRSFITHSGEKAERYIIYKASRRDAILLNESTISQYDTSTYHYLLDTNIDMRDEGNVFFIDDQWFNVINIHEPGYKGRICYFISEFVTGGMKDLKYYNKTFYAVKYNSTELCRIVIVD